MTEEQRKEAGSAERFDGKSFMLGMFVGIWLLSILELVTK